MATVRGVFGPILLPIIFGACVTATVRRPTHDTTQVMRAVSEVRDQHTEIVADAAADEPVAVTLDEEPAVPVHPIEDKTEHKSTPARSFTRTLDRARIEARGAARIGARVDATTLRAAVPLDNDTWRADQRRELLAHLRGGAVHKDKDKNAAFTDADARIVTRLQAGSGAAVDGVLGDETMAVLLAMGFRFPLRKALPSEVKLEFYPGELEDLDAWKREIEAKVTKNRRGFHDVIEPDGEGTIYVRVGGSIVMSYRARGGPPSPLEDGDHVAIPTTPGNYRLGPAHTHVSRNWYFSQIPWGAEIRRNEDGYQYRWAGRTTWSWATPHPENKMKDPYDDHDFMGLPEVTRAGVTYLIWNKNDFGPVAWNLAPSDLYLHTTPAAEAEAAQDTRASFSLSHGCIHVDPRERDEMVSRGYLATGVPFVVRRWDEHLLPDEVRNEMINGTVSESSSESKD